MIEKSSKILAVIMLFSLQSCMTIINKGKQEINFSSDQKNVKMYIDGKNYGALPQSPELSRCKDHDIIFVRDDFEEKHINLVRENSFLKTFFSAFMFGPIGIVIDDSNCALDDFEQSKINVAFDK